MTHQRKNLGLTLAIFGAIVFIVCFFWQYFIPLEVQQLHTDLLRLSVLGWTGMDFGSFLLGIIQWTVWGWLIGVTFNLIQGLTSPSSMENMTGMGAMGKMHDKKMDDCCKDEQMPKRSSCCG